MRKIKFLLFKVNKINSIIKKFSFLVITFFTSGGIKNINFFNYWQVLREPNLSNIYALLI